MISWFAVFLFSPAIRRTYLDRLQGFLKAVFPIVVLLIVCTAWMIVCVNGVRETEYLWGKGLWAVGLMPLAAGVLRTILELVVERQEAADGG